MKEEDEIIKIQMNVPQLSYTAFYYVRKVGDNLFELTDNDPFNEELIYKTIIEVLPEKNANGEYVFNKVYKKSEYSLETFHLSGILKESELRLVGKMIENEGGYWEVIFGGLGFVNLPKGSKLDVNAELSKLIKLKQEKKN